MREFGAGARSRPRAGVEWCDAIRRRHEGSVSSAKHVPVRAWPPENRTAPSACERPERPVAAAAARASFVRRAIASRGAILVLIANV
jgi:hypothetical protein